MTTAETVCILSTLTTRDHAGRHFTERHTSADLADLESRGLITIGRPVHEPTGIPYGQEHWAVEVTAEGVGLVEANPEDWPPEAGREGQPCHS